MLLRLAKRSGGCEPLQVPPVAENHCKFRLLKCLRLAEGGKTAGFNEAVIYKTSGGCEPLQVPPIKIIVLTECNPSVLTADKFGKLKKAGVSQVKRNKATVCALPSIHLPFFEGEASCDSAG